MRTFDELSNLWNEGPAPRVGEGTLRAIGVRLGGGEHDAVESVGLSADEGVAGDRWQLAADPERRSQVTLMNHRAAELIADGQPVVLAGDNLFVDIDLSEAQVAAGDRVVIGEVELEMTPEPHNGCKKFSARFGSDALKWVNGKAFRSQRLRGIHCMVVKPGTVRVGDPIRVDRRAMGR